MPQLATKTSWNPFKGMRKHSRAYLVSMTCSHTQRPASAKRQLALACYWAALLFGYDTGVAGSTIALQGFVDDFKLEGDPIHVANLKSNVVAVLQAGCFFGALAAAPISQRWGRKWSLMGYAVIFLIGGVVQTIATTSLAPI